MSAFSAFKATGGIVAGAVASQVLGFPSDHPIFSAIENIKTPV
jgi:hypothetical protein